MRRLVWCVLVVIGARASAPAAGRTLVMVGAGFGATQEESGPPGALGFVAGVLHPLPHSRDAIGVEVAYQMLGSASADCGRMESVVPITLQAYRPISIRRARMAYLTAGGGVYVRHWGTGSGCYYLYDPSSHFRAPDGTTATSGGFNFGIGAKSRAPRGETAYGVDLRFHAMYPRGYTSMWTAGARLYF